MCDASYDYCIKNYHQEHTLYYYIIPGGSWGTWTLLFLLHGTGALKHFFNDIYTMYTIIYILNISVARLKTQSLIYLHFSWARKMLASFAQVTVTSDFNFIDKNPIKPIPFDSKHGSPNQDSKPNIIQNKVVGLLRFPILQSTTGSR